jgi:hypothetical protein
METWFCDQADFTRKSSTTQDGIPGPPEGAAEQFQEFNERDLKAGKQLVRLYLNTELHANCSGHVPSRMRRCNIDGCASIDEAR